MSGTGVHEISKESVKNYMKKITSPLDASKYARVLVHVHCSGMISGSKVQLCLICLEDVCSLDKNS